MQYWLFKSDKDCYSIEDLKKQKVTSWDGVRNYQARNFMMDMKLGDLGFFYHSGKEPEIVAIVELVKEAYPDYTALDPTNDHFDPKASTNKPLWYMVDVKLTEVFNKAIPRAELYKHTELFSMELLKKGSRLSVQKVTKDEFNFIVSLSKS